MSAPMQALAKPGKRRLFLAHRRLGLCGGGCYALAPVAAAAFHAPPHTHTDFFSFLDSPITERSIAKGKAALLAHAYTNTRELENRLTPLTALSISTKEDAAAAVVNPMEASCYIYTYRIFVSGRVQGVFYRKYTALKATELGVTGFVRNLPDGRVEILAEGTKEQISALETWCYRGSPKSQVTAVDVENCTEVVPPSGGAEAMAKPPVHRTMNGFVVSR